MKADQILDRARAAGANPRIVDGIIVTDRIEDRRLVAVFRDALDSIRGLLVREQREAEARAE